MSAIKNFPNDTEKQTSFQNNDNFVSGSRRTSRTLPIVNEEEDGIPIDDPILMDNLLMENTDQNESNADADTLCGFLGVWTPRFLQPLANMKTFVVMYIFQDIFRSMFFSYWTSSISTVERRYRLPSKWVGSFSAMGEGGKLVCVLLFAHFGGRGHRPRWMAFACLCVALAAAIIVIPETFVPLPSQTDLINYNSNTSKASSKRRAIEEMCVDSKNSLYNSSQKCNSVEAAAAFSLQASMNTKIWWAIGLFIVGHTVIDAGGGIPRTVGVPFVYDNVKLSSTPLYYVFMYAGRLIGPLSGYTLGSLTSRLYIDPYNVPAGTTINDPQWIGAWYLGFIGIFVGEMLASFLFLWFPPRVRRDKLDESANPEQVALANAGNPHASQDDTKRRHRRYGEKGRQASRQESKAHLKDLPRDLVHLLKNPFIIFVIFGRAIDVLGSAGFRHLTPKYLENHFRVTTSKANVFTGVSQVLAYAISGFIGAFVIKKFNLQPRGIGILMLITQIIVAFGTMSLALFPCDGPRMAGQTAPDKPFDVGSPCSNDCGCTDAAFTPICDRSTGINYYSPCRAGCTLRLNSSSVLDFLRSDGNKSNNEVTKLKETLVEGYTNCACLINSTTVLTRGYCSTAGSHNESRTDSFSCNDMFYYYTAVKMALAFIGGLPSVGGIMLLFRFVEPELKSLASGLLSFTATLMGFLPGSVIAGSILDASCILWNKAGANSCGVSSGLSNCLLYDNRTMRVRFHLFVSILRVVGLIFDAASLWWVWNVRFHDSDERKQEKMREKNKK